MSLLKILLSKPSSVAKGVSMRNGLALRLMREKRKWFSNYLGRQSFLTQNSFHLQQMDAESSPIFFYIYDTETETIPSPLTYVAGYSTTFAERAFGNPW